MGMIITLAGSACPVRTGLQDVMVKSRAGVPADNGAIEGDMHSAELLALFFEVKGTWIH